jgi:predicted MFS family arabinose efflux permease
MRTATIALGVAQTLGFGSTYYLPAILADGMARDLGVTPPWIFGAFTVSLLILAALGPAAGRWIDLRGGRGMLVVSSLIFAAGLALLGAAESLAMLYLAWVVLGVGMAAGLYEAAFATMTKLIGRDARGSITGITLIAGFASTVAWPLTAWMEARYGWRGACYGWAALHLTLGLGMNLLVPAHRSDEPTAARIETLPADAADTARERRIMILLSLSFGAGLFTSTALAAHLPRLLELSGATPAAAIAAAALLGPAQVAARLAEFSLLRQVHPLFIARGAMATHPAAVLALMAFGGPAAAVFTLIHGAGNGIQTIAKGTLPLVLFGPEGYGRRQGVISAPGRVAQAFAPLAFGLMIERAGPGALWVTAALGVFSTLLLWRLAPERR